MYLLGINMVVFSQTEWVAFTSPDPSAPIFRLQSSTNQLVNYDVEIPGIFTEIYVVGSETYQRLSIPKTGSWDYIGYPELPSINKLIAIPECDSVIISWLVTDSIVLNDYNVYPKPAIIEDSANSTLIELFTKNDSVYQLDMNMPESDFKILSDGYLRNQRTVRIGAYPIKYNPVTQRLVAYTNFEVSLTFHNSQGEVNIDNGLLSNITKSTLLNYNLDNAQLPPFPVGRIGSVTWKTMVSPDEADNIVADYLIITDDPFFTPHSYALQNLANHRAVFNGFDVVIVSVDNILDPNLNFEYNNSSPVRLHAEQKIRSFLKRVYDGQHAINTYDGHVAFVCLVGDAFDDASTDGVPTSFDPDPTGINSVTFISANDYYYTCVTKPGNVWDKTGDFFIGRLCADDEMDLSNIVAKIKHNENEYSFDDWRYINTLAFGGPMAYPPTPTQPEIQYFTVDLLEWLNGLYEPVYSTVLINAIGAVDWKSQYISHINSPGSNIVFHYGHGTDQLWIPELTLDYKKTNMSNSGKYPFVMSQSCNTGGFTNFSGPDCMGEEILLYDDANGYAAYLGNWTSAAGASTSPGDFPHTLQEHIFSAIYENLSTVLGEAILEARLNVMYYHPTHFEYNLFGDPAMNLMALGYEITHNTTIPSAPPSTTISTKVYVRPGATLSLSQGAILEFSDNGKLIIDEGATLEIGNNVTIRGQITFNSILVNGVMCGPGGNINNPVPITNLSLESIPGRVWEGIKFDNAGLTVILQGGSITDCQLTGQLTKLELTNSTAFQNSAIVLDQSELFIDQCNFSMTQIHLTNSNENDVNAQIQYSQFQDSYSDAMIRIEHYPSFVIRNCTIYYSSGTGIDLYYSGEENNQNLIFQNIIQRTGGGQVTSWGVKVYNSFANIEQNYISSNRYGVSCLNNSHVQIKGNPGATTSSQTQNITNNYQNQVRATDNSFPWYLHYNILQNTPSGSTYLIYYDPVFPDPPPVDNLFNVKCNCYDNSNPPPQLYPSGWYDWYEIWCASPTSCLFDDQAQEDFEEAVASMDTGQYETAETQFKDIIDQYPGSIYAKESAKTLIPLTKLDDQDFPGLINYFDTANALQQDSNSAHLIYRLRNKCTIEMDQYEQAITWFENDILSPASEQDSLFSLIDLSDTYMLMEADSSLKSTLAYIGSLIQYKPKDWESYTNQREEWVKLLFTDDPNLPEEEHSWNQDETNFIKQIIPNPFEESIEVWIDVPGPGIMSLIAHNLLGQEVKKISQRYPNAGIFSIVFDLSGLPNGVYLIITKFNGKENGKAKAVKFN
jgi:tetratricopeptide (TPR) repeat protein